MIQASLISGLMDMETANTYEQMQLTEPCAFSLKKKMALWFMVHQGI